MTANVLKQVDRSKHIRGSNERLFIMTQTQNLHIFGEIPFFKPQNNT